MTLFNNDTNEIFWERNKQIAQNLYFLEIPSEFCHFFAKSQTNQALGKVTFSWSLIDYFFCQYKGIVKVKASFLKRKKIWYLQQDPVNTYMLLYSCSCNAPGY